MAEITYSAKRDRTTSWSSWMSASYQTVMSLRINSRYAVFKGNISNDNDMILSQCSIKLSFEGRKNEFTTSSSNITVRVCLYTEDPTKNAPEARPVNYIAQVEKTISVPASCSYIVEDTSGEFPVIDVIHDLHAADETFSFTDLSISNAKEVYFWVELTSNISSSLTVYLYDSKVSNVEGTKNLALSASFVPPPLNFTGSPSTVKSGNSLTIDLSGWMGGTVTATFRYGNTQLEVKQFAAKTASITCPGSWFDRAGLNLVKSMTVNVTVQEDTRSASSSFTLEAGEDLAPVMREPAVQIVQPAQASGFPNTYLANISKAKVTVLVRAPSNAAISGVSLSYPGGENSQGTKTGEETRSEYEDDGSIEFEFNSASAGDLTPNATVLRVYEVWECVTAAPITGNTTFTVTARDQRGLTASATVNLSGVVPYTLPSLNIKSAYRSDASKNRLDGGAYCTLLVQAKYYSALSGNSIKKLTAKLKNSASTVNITSGASALVPGLTNPNSKYTVVVTIQDQVSGEITREVVLEGQQRNVAIRRSGDGTYVGIGTTPSRSSGKSSVELPNGGSFLINGIESGAIARLVNSNINGVSFGKDFLNVETEYVDSEKNAAAAFYLGGNDASNWSNVPGNLSAMGGIRYVIASPTWYYRAVIVFEFTPTQGRIWINVSDADGSGLQWSGWKQLTPTA